MRYKKGIIWGLILAAGLFFSGPAAHADSGRGGSHQKQLSKMFFHKTHFILKNEKELELSDEQVKVIRALKVGAKKEYIRQKAEASIVDVDIRALLYEDSVDVDQVNTLIDRKYGIKAAKAKGIAGAFAKLKAQLSEKQWDKLKELKKAKSASYHEGSHGKKR
jgi:Spy/CpxP family protein refolding chaperone